MSTDYEVKYPEDMMTASGMETPSWAESALQSAIDSVEDYARARPLSFALWTFGIGFVLGWKLKPW